MEVRHRAPQKPHAKITNFTYASILPRLLEPEEEDTINLLNIRNYWPSDAVLHHGRV
jgi:hypothetical protein